MSAKTRGWREKKKMQKHNGSGGFEEKINWIIHGDENAHPVTMKSSTKLKQKP